MSPNNEDLIKGVVFDLDNTLLDFMKMKQVAVRSAIRGMIEAGLEIDEDKSFDNIISLYEQIGWENQKVFDVFLENSIALKSFASLKPRLLALFFCFIFLHLTEHLIHK